MMIPKRRSRNIWAHFKFTFLVIYFLLSVFSADVFSETQQKPADPQMERIIQSVRTKIRYVQDKVKTIESQQNQIEAEMQQLRIWIHKN